MADIKTLKFIESDFTGKDIVSLSNTPSADGMSAAQLKARFDQIGKSMIAMGRINELIDSLASTVESFSGAKNIGAVTQSGTPTDVQTRLDRLAESIQESGGGDMIRDTYDVDRSGVVDNSQRLNGELASYYLNTAQRSGAIDSTSAINVATSAAVNTLRNRSLAYSNTSITVQEIATQGTGVYTVSGGTAIAGLLTYGTAIITNVTARRMYLFIDINGGMAVAGWSADTGFSGWKVLNGASNISPTVSANFTGTSVIRLSRKGDWVLCSGYLAAANALAVNSAGFHIITVPSGFKPTTWITSTAPFVSGSTAAFAQIANNWDTLESFRLYPYSSVPQGAIHYISLAWQTTDAMA